ncbi:HdaA/DnaA family protein [Roseateles paludis]|uniref:DnaA/Hda family protein n=1 Tax=Roseateles paludis TaxID=3145238 RepID=A0ABV0G7N7_9BURK
MKQLPLAIQAPPDFSFESYLPGTHAANHAALAELAGLRPGSAPVLLWGAAGVGKSHLLRALARRWMDAGEQVAWYDPTTPLPWAWPPQASLLLFDDCQAFDEPRQHAAFTLFVETAGQGVAIVASADRPAVDLPVREDLRTRLGWGPSYALVHLGEAETRAVLRREADRRGLLLGDDLLDYLLTRFDRQLGGLMQLLVRLDTFALSHKRGLTLPLLKQMLADPDSPPTDPTA